MFKLAAIVLLALCATGCSSMSYRNDHFKLYFKNDNVKNFVVTNDKHPREPFAVIVKPHEADFTFNYHF